MDVNSQDVLDSVKALSERVDRVLGGTLPSDSVSSVVACLLEKQSASVDQLRVDLDILKGSRQSLQRDLERKIKFWPRINTGIAAVVGAVFLAVTGYQWTEVHRLVEDTTKVVADQATKLDQTVAEANASITNILTNSSEVLAVATKASETARESDEKISTAREDFENVMAGSRKILAEIETSQVRLKAQRERIDYLRQLSEKAATYALCALADNQSANVFAEAGTLAFNAGDSKSAARIWEAGLSRYPDDRSILLRLARVDWEEGRGATATERINRLLVRDAHDIDAMCMAAEFESLSANSEAALSILEPEINSRSTNRDGAKDTGLAKLLTARGQVYLSDNEPLKAISDFEAAAQQNPEDPWTLVYCAEALKSYSLESGLDEATRKDYTNQALEKCDELLGRGASAEPEAYVDVAVCKSGILTSMGESEDALFLLESAKLWRPQDRTLDKLIAGLRSSINSNNAKLSH
ncbi:MAG: hypothetical protein K1Y02_16590 [Candidatus Hydrogenedentes bacterium]|nr:hypothetical protein [Candidatus Hydrogenedentota bacterium]